MAKSCADRAWTLRQKALVAIVARRIKQFQNRAVTETKPANTKQASTMVMLVNPKSASERVVAGRYVLLDEIGVGGMATVHIGRLRGAAGFTRTVAIKRLHPSLARDPEFVSMLIDEAYLASRIRHPNVVQTLDAIFEQQELFLIMDYIHGESLAHLLKAARKQGVNVPYNIAISVIADVLRGLHAVHETKDVEGENLELVHCDISPQNILVGADGLTRIIDFGIAKSAEHENVSHYGAVKGKLAYIAPEQIRSEQVDRRADIYSASVVLWEALTGQRLVQEDSPNSTLAKVLAGDVPAPSSVTKGLPSHLDEVVLRGLALNPADRYESAKAMATDLERCCRLESRSGIADWLESVGSERLKEKAERVARIERAVYSKQHSDPRELIGPLIEIDSDHPEEHPDRGNASGLRGQDVKYAGIFKSGIMPSPQNERLMRWRYGAIVGTVLVLAAVGMATLKATSAKVQAAILNVPKPETYIRGAAEPQPVAASSAASSTAPSAQLPNLGDSERPRKMDGQGQMHISKPTELLVRHARSHGPTPPRARTAASPSPFNGLGGRL